MRDRYVRGEAAKGASKHAINEEIKASEVRLIGVQGEQLGVLRTDAALRMATDAGVDLVEVAPEAKPPVCKLLDYGKLKYREQKKQAEAKKHGASQQIKEIRVRYSTDDHDLETKIRSAKKFIASGDRVKFQMRFRGRERSYRDLGEQTFDKIATLMSDVAAVEQRLPLLGNTMSIIFVAGKPGTK
ncbi:MAG: translation initiation factor IF-3 [Deltaproteobacteria bacterium]|nr:translation initiation factor IF-3 [Deltaproteobacteria bacterium]